VTSLPPVTQQSPPSTAISGPVTEGHGAADAPVWEEALALHSAPPAAATSQWMHTFIAAAAHDLKNEMAVVRGTSQLLERRMRRGPPLDVDWFLGGLALIQCSTTKMHTLVEEFFDLSRVESGQPLQLNRQPTDLVALARACVEEFARTTPQALILATTLDSLVGDWDAARLERVLTNLVSNAIKYSAAGSAIRVEIAVDATGRRDVAVVRVQDEGVGIPAHDLPHIFTPFYRGSNVVDRVDGTGIGLFGARAIVEQLGGTLDLQSTEAVGTTVTLRLPLTA